MKISKSLEWLLPFLEDAHKILPEMALLDAVRSRTPKNSKREVQRIHGIIWDTAGRFKITIMTKKQRYLSLSPVKVKLIPYSKIAILQILAHELAHMRFWPHSPHHEKLTCQLQMIFMDRLTSLGYISEEEELKGTTLDLDIFKR